MKHKPSCLIYVCTCNISKPLSEQLQGLKDLNNELRQELEILEDLVLKENEEGSCE